MSRALLLALASAFISCARPRAPGSAGPTQWLGTWTASPQLVESRNMPPAPGLTGSTLRQVFHVSIGGPVMRLHFSNAFGDAPLAITAAHIARSRGASAIDSAAGRKLTFAGLDSVLIAAGASATSDPLAYEIAPLSDLTVTVQIRTAPAALTGHPGSRTTSYLQTGNWVTASELPAAATTDHWYLLTGLDVQANGAAVVTLGNSITDGRGSGTNRNDRWPDNLARRLQTDPRTRNIAVLNAGIGGNAVLAGGLGPTALQRLDRDVVEQPGARWVILLEGVNDIGATREPGQGAAVAQGLVAAYGQIVERVHSRGLRIYGATILPFGGSQYDGEEREAARQAVNQWIRTSGAFDAVIDFDAVLRDPAQPTRLLPSTDTGDHLHPNEDGYRIMANAIDLTLFLSR